MQYISVSNVKYHIIMIMYFTVVSNPCLSAKTKGASISRPLLFLRLTEGNPGFVIAERLRSKNPCLFTDNSLRINRLLLFCFSAEYILRSRGIKSPSAGSGTVCLEIAA